MAKARGFTAIFGKISIGIGEKYYKNRNYFPIIIGIVGRTRPKSHYAHYLGFNIVFFVSII